MNMLQKIGLLVAWIAGWFVLIGGAHLAFNPEAGLELVALVGASLVLGSFCWFVVTPELRRAAGWVRNKRHAPE